MNLYACLVLAVVISNIIVPSPVQAQKSNGPGAGPRHIDDPCPQGLFDYAQSLRHDLKILFDRNPKPKIEPESCTGSLTNFLDQTQQDKQTAPSTLTNADLLRQIYCAQTVLNRYSYPEPIKDGNVCAPSDNDPDPLPCSKLTPPPLSDSQKKALVQVAGSVGRIELKIRDQVASSRLLPGEPRARHYLWATGFLVARDVVATSCHAIQSLLVEKGGRWVLQKEAGQDLVIDFEEDTTDYGDTQAYDNDREFQITDVLGYSQERGLDVILLKVKTTSIIGHYSLPQGLTLSSQPITDRTSLGKGMERDDRASIALVGYPDLYHPVDPGTMSQWAYGFYKGTEFAKFAALGSAKVSKCTKFDILAHDATTMVGESGSAIFLKDKLDPNNPPEVIGLHTCCALPSQEYATPPRAKMPCADLTNTYLNQAISSWSILNDSDLCTVLWTHGVTCPHTAKEHPSK